jgi:hypothetical protein
MIQYKKLLAARSVEASKLHPISRPTLQPFERTEMTPEQEKQYIDDAFSGKVPARGASNEKEWNSRYSTDSVPGSTKDTPAGTPAGSSAEADSTQLEARLQELRATERGYKTRRRTIPAEVAADIRQEKQKLKALLRARQ